MGRFGGLPRAQYRDVRNARRDPYGQIQVLPYGLLDKEPRGDWASRPSHQ